jgi:hypothetical protein
MDKKVPYYSNGISVDDYLTIQEDNRDINYAETALKSHITCPMNYKLSRIFFSKRNIKKLQERIKFEVNKRTKGLFKLVIDQDEGELVIAMRGVFLDHAKFLPFDIEGQIATLNATVIDFIVPDMITAMKQDYGYKKDMEQPLRLLPRPINASSSGKNVLPSITTLWK